MITDCRYPSISARWLPHLRFRLKRTVAIGAVAFVAVSAACSLPVWAQTAEEQERQYSKEQLQQALDTRERYELYGIHFDVGKATIQPGAEQLLDDVATALKSFPDWRLRIVGHTDDTGNPEANTALSLERASAIMAALVERGVDGARLQAGGLGQQQPIASNTTAEGKALNRRVELVRLTDSAEAKKLLKAMSDYLAAQNNVSFRYNANLEVVTQTDQKLGVASSGAVVLSRPDKLHAIRSGGFVEVESLFDGKTLTLLGKNLNKYTQIEVPGTVDHLIDALRDKGLPLPAADLLTTDAYSALMEDVYDSKDLGSGVINGVECDSLAFRKDDVDFQIWVAQGSETYPCRLVITSKGMQRSPSYSVEVSDWKTGDAVAKENFTFTNASNAEQIDPTEIKEKLGDLPGNLVVGEKK
jgi:hypothetical protein